MAFTFTEQEPEIISLEQNEAPMPSPFTLEEIVSTDFETARREAEEARAGQSLTHESEEPEEPLRGPQGERGQDGHTPTDEELLELIVPLIPEPRRGEDGKTPTTKELLALIRPLIPKVKDGKTPTKGELTALIKTLIPAPIQGREGKSGRDGKDGSPDTGEQIVTKVNGLEVDPKKQIDFKHIKNFPWHKVREEGEKGSLASWGNPVSIEVPMGTIDDSNTAFVFTKEPTLISINGSLYSSASTVGGATVWTWSGSTATLAFPVGSGGDLYGIIF